MKNLWLGPLGKALRQLYVVAIGSAVLAVLNELSNLDIDTSQWPWWALVLAIVKALDGIIRAAIVKKICEARGECE